MKGHHVVREYPDMNELFARKKARRQKLASLPIAQKMEIAERLRQMALNAPGRIKTIDSSMLKRST